jgi:hypothetical protein
MIFKRKELFGGTCDCDLDSQEIYDILDDGDFAWWMVRDNSRPVWWTEKGISRIIIVQNNRLCSVLF